MSVTLRPYQTRCVAALLSQDRGIIQVPAGGGKTIIAASALKAHLAKNPGDNIAWIANTIDQCSQARAAFKTVGIDDSNILVMCYAAQPDLSEADVVVVDECHHVPAVSLAAIMEPVRGKRWGLSATPLCGDPDRDLATLQTLGGIIARVKREELIADGHLAPAVVTLHDHACGSIVDAVEMVSQPEFDKLLWMNRKSPQMFIEACNRVRFRHAYKLGVVDCGPRNQTVVNVARREIAKGESVLALVKEVEHGQRLAVDIPGAEVCYSSLGKKRRVELLENFKSGAITCLIATSLADEGLDVPRASSLILAAGGRHAGRLEQRTGRVLRTFAGKERGVIHDFTDTHHFMLSAQSKARQRVYKELGYQIEKGER